MFCNISSALSFEKCGDFGKAECNITRVFQNRQYNELYVSAFMMIVVSFELSFPVASDTKIRSIDCSRGQMLLCISELLFDACSTLNGGSIP